jgi:hypothetical protein
MLMEMVSANRGETDFQWILCLVIIIYFGQAISSVLADVNRNRTFEIPVGNLMVTFLGRCNGEDRNHLL